MKGNTFSYRCLNSILFALLLGGLTPSAFAQQFSIFDTTIPSEPSSWIESTIDASIISISYSESESNRMEVYTSAPNTIRLKEHKYTSGLLIPPDNAGYYSVSFGTQSPTKAFREEVELLQSIPGHSPTTVRTILSHKRLNGLETPNSVLIDNDGDVLLLTTKHLAKGRKVRENIYWSDNNGTKKIDSRLIGRKCKKESDGKRYCSPNISLTFMDPDGNALIIPSSERHIKYRPAQGQFHIVTFSSELKEYMPNMYELRGDKLLLTNSKDMIAYSILASEVVNKIEYVRTVASGDQFEFNSMAIDAQGTIVGLADLYVKNGDENKLNSFFVKRVKQEVQIPACNLGSNPSKMEERIGFITLSESGIFRVALQNAESGNIVIHSFDISPAAESKGDADYTCGLADLS